MMKSFFALWLAKEAAHAGCPVLYIDLENSLSIIRNRFHTLKISESDETRLKYWGNWSPEHPPRGPDATYLEIARRYKPVMIFDALNRFHNYDENNATLMSRVTAFFRKLAEAGACPVVIHQAGKSYEGNASIYRGSTEIGAGCDIGYKIFEKEVKKDKSRPTLSLRHFKNRVDIEEERISMTLNPDLGAFVFSETERVAMIRGVIVANGGEADRETIISKVDIGRNRVDEILHQGIRQKWWYFERSGKTKSKMVYKLFDS
jgi:hypothetical protein